MTYLLTTRFPHSPLPTDTMADADSHVSQPRPRTLYDKIWDDHVVYVARIAVLTNG